MNTISDQLLIQLYNETRDNQYFAELYNRYRKLVYEKCLRFLKDTALAEDSVQEIFIKVQVNLLNYRGKSQFKTWLFVVTHNYCADQARLRQKQKNLFIQGEWDSLNIGLNDEDAVQNEIRIARINYALQQLPMPERTILKLKYQYLFSVNDIALLSGLTNMAVKMRLLRYKEKFRRSYLKCLQEEQAFDTAVL